MLRHVPKRIGTGIDLLADPTRRRIVAILALRVGRPSRIASELGLSAATVSYQLRLLREAGLIRPLPSMLDRRVIDYGIDPAAYERILAWLVLTDVVRPELAALPAIGRPAPGKFDVRRAGQAAQGPSIELLEQKEAQWSAAASRRARLRLEARAARRAEVDRLRSEGLGDADIKRRLRADAREDGW